MRTVDAGTVEQVLTMPRAIAWLDEGFHAELPSAPQRSRVPVEGGELLLMPASGPDGAGVKLVSVAEGNPARGLPLVQGVYVLFAPDTLEPLAVIDGAALTTVRTAAVSGWMTAQLARDDARRLVIFGSGTQAHAHLAAMRAVREVTEVVVVARRRETGEELVEAARATGLEAELGEASSIATADLVCLCTTSATPLFDGRLLPDGVHVNAVGAHSPGTRELDATAIARARVVVETRAAALTEAGDLLLAIEEDAITTADIDIDIETLVQGARVRRGPEDITVFKSVGVAFEDLLLAERLVAALSRET